MSMLNSEVVKFGYTERHRVATEVYSAGSTLNST
jgi:hypothetical protein